MAPLRSQSTICRQPIESSSLAMAAPAAPAPRIATRTAVEFLLHDLQRIVQRRGNHDGRAVLIVVKHGNIELGNQPLLDLDAPRRGDVFEIDAAERRRQKRDGLDDLVDVLRIEADRKGVDAAEFLEEHALALHHRHGGPRADVAQPQHRRSVGDHGHGILADRQREARLGIGGDRAAHAGDSRRVDHRQVVAGLDRRLRADLDLAAMMQQERAIGHANDRHAGDLPHPLDHGFAMLDVAGADDDVAGDLALFHLDDVDRADQAVGLADGRADWPNRPGKSG